MPTAPAAFRCRAFPQRSAGVLLHPTALPGPGPIGTLGTDYVDVLQLHGVLPAEYAYARDTLGPALLEQKAKGKIRHIGITEQPVEDFTHETLLRAVNDGLWEVFMLAFHMMHPEKYGEFHNALLGGQGRATEAAAITATRWSSRA